MTTWIEAGYRFNRHAAVVKLPMEFCHAHQEILRIANQETTPEMLHNAIRDWVLKHRPDLEGCCISSVQLKFETQTYEGIVVHPKLAVVPCGAWIPELILEERRGCGMPSHHPTCDCDGAGGDR